MRAAVAGGVLLVAGGALALSALFAPQSIERAYGEIKTTLSGAVDDVREEAFDVRNTPKVWPTIDDLVGIEGSFALQTCYYGEDRMKFIGLEPVDQNP